MQEYTVRMSATIREHAIVTVQASNPDAAKRKARQLAHDGDVEFCDSDQVRVRVTDCEATDGR